MTGRQPFLRTALPERGAAVVPCPGLAYHRARLPPSAIAEIYFNLRFDGGYRISACPGCFPVGLDGKGCDGVAGVGWPS